MLAYRIFCLDEVNTIDVDCQNDEIMLDRWQSGYEDSFTDEAKCAVLEITEHSDNSCQSVTEYHHYSDMDDETEFINDESPPINSDDIHLLEAANRENQSQDQFLSTLHEHYESIENEVEIVTAVTAETETPTLAQSTEFQTKTFIIPKRFAEEETLHQSQPDKVNACDVAVSSSSNKSDQISSSPLSLPDTSSEDKYFALSLVGILQRIPPQTRAFAKLNIMRYLTELEYGQETSLK